MLRKYLGATAGWLFFDAKSLQFFHSISSSYDQGKIQKSLQSGHLDWKRRKDEEYFPNVDDLEFLGYMILGHSFHRIFLKYMKIISMRLCKNSSYLKIIISLRTYTVSKANVDSSKNMLLLKNSQFLPRYSWVPYFGKVSW